MRISDWSSDVCSSDLGVADLTEEAEIDHMVRAEPPSPGRKTLAHRFQDARPPRHLDQMPLAIVEATRLDAAVASERPGNRKSGVSGKRSVNTCRSRWWPYTSKRKQHTYKTEHK